MQIEYLSTKLVVKIGHFSTKLVVQIEYSCTKFSTILQSHRQAFDSQNMAFEPSATFVVTCQSQIVSDAITVQVDHPTRGWPRSEKKNWKIDEIKGS